MTPNEPEAELYRLVSERVREQGRGAGPVQTLALRSVQRLAGSSPQALLPTLLEVGWQDLAQRAAAVQHTAKAAGEGRNLQFCHVMINFDLPWNPMQIEQRLGRIHRIGQDHDVLLTNLVTRGTVEEHILRVLEAKVHLFELVVGKLDMILGRVQDDFDFEAFVSSAYVESRHDEEFGARLTELGEDLARAREGYLDSRRRTDALVPEDAAT